MRQTEVIELMEKCGVKISGATLARYEAQGLIPKSEKNYGGRHAGTSTEYHSQTPSEALASNALLNGRWGDEKTKKLFGGTPPRIPPDTIFIARTVALANESDEEMEANPTKWTNDDDFKYIVIAERILKAAELNSLTNHKLIQVFASAWRDERDRAQELIAKINAAG